MELGPGAVIAGRYVLEEPLGDEMLGPVWRARAEGFPEGVRVKVLRAGSDAERSRRFSREAEVTRGLVSPSVLAVLEEGEHAGVPYLVYEHVPARTLQDLINDGPIAPDRAASIVRGAAAGLAAAHKEGVVHRNLTPYNVLLLDDDHVKIRDFGLATMVDGEVPTQLTRDEERVGSAAVMAPEYAADATVSRKCDVYALGVLLYQATTGKPPYEGREALAAKVAMRPPYPSEAKPGLPEWVDRLTVKLLAVRPGDRPDVDEVIARLERVLRGQPELVDDDTPRFDRRRLALAAGGVVAVTGLVGLAIWAIPRIPVPSWPEWPEDDPLSPEVAAAPAPEPAPLEVPAVVRVPDHAPPTLEEPLFVPHPRIVYTGTVRVRSNRRVLVQVDGVGMGYTPIDLQVPAGSHRISVSLAARPDTLRERSVNVGNGSDELLHFVF